MKANPKHAVLLAQSLWVLGADQEGCRSPAMPNGRCRHGGMSPSARKEINALKHGLYTADAAARRRKISALVRAMRALAKDVI